ncbi:LamG domain-containing protein [bacterium]|nr:LamG domain-containing protein [bacterium]
MGRKFITYNGVIVGNGGLTLLSTETDTPTPPSFTNTKSILLDGIDDYVDFNTTIVGTTFSISAWFKVANTTDLQPIVSTRENSISTSKGIDIYVQNNILTFRIYRNGGTSVTQAFTDLGWNHVLYVYEGTTLEGFLNGVSIGSVVGTYATGTQTLKAGIFVPSSAYAETNIDEVALFYTDESANASTIYNSGVPNDISSLSPVSWWRCGDGDTSPTLTDNGSGGNDGTMTNFTTFSTDVPTFNTKSILLDGVDDFCETASTYSELDGQSKMTVSAWIKAGTLSSQSYLFGIGGGTNLFQVAVRLQSISSTNARCWLYISQASNSRRSYADLIGIKNDGAWHHLLVCLDLTQPGFSEAAFFLDGSQLTTNGYYTPTALENSGTALAIGNRENPNTGLMVGNIDEFALWSGTDLRASAATIYNSGVPNDLNNNGLTAPTTWYRMGDGDTAPTLTDNGSGGNNGTMANFTTFSTDVP